MYPFWQGEGIITGPCAILILCLRTGCMLNAECAPSDMNVDSWMSDLGKPENILSLAIHLYESWYIYIPKSET